MAYATTADIEARLGRTLDPSETQIATTRLGDAELIIRSRVRDLDVLVTSGTLDRGLVVMVEADALLRLIRNPDGYTTETDGNYTYSIDASVASGRLQILDSEWALLGVRRSVFVLAPKVTLPSGFPRYPERENATDEDLRAVWWGD